MWIWHDVWIWDNMWIWHDHCVDVEQLELCMRPSDGGKTMTNQKPQILYLFNLQFLVTRQNIKNTAPGEG